MQNLLLSQRALADIYAAIDYLGEQNLEFPQRFIDELERVYSLINEQPNIGNEVSYAKREGFLMHPLIKYRYLLFYVIEDDGRPRLTRVIHSSRRVEQVINETSS